MNLYLCQKLIKLKKMKKLFVVIFSISLLTACGSNSEGKSCSKENCDKESCDHKKEGCDENCKKPCCKKEGETVQMIDGYEKYGLAEITSEGAITIEELVAKVGNTGDEVIKVKGNINEVCKKMGCWMNLKTSDSTTMMVYFKDHFTIPKDSTVLGREVIIQGVIKADTVSVEMQKHLLDDKKEAGEEVTEKEYAAITGPKFEHSIECDAILIK